MYYPICGTVAGIQNQGAYAMSTIRISLLIVLTVGCAVSFSACDNSASPTAKDNGSGTHGFGIGTFNSVDLNTYGGIDVALTKITTPSGTNSWERMRASFWDPDSSYPVDAGTITFNGTALSKRTGATGVHYDSYDKTSGAYSSVPVTFNNTFHSFTVSGSELIESFTDSMLSPSGELAITYPTASDTVDKSSGFTITWSSSGADTAALLITDTSRTDGYRFALFVPDDGSYTVTAGDLSTIAPGPIHVCVSRGNYAIVDIGSDHHYLLTINQTHVMDTYMAP